MILDNEILIFFIVPSYESVSPQNFTHSATKVGY